MVISHFTSVYSYLDYHLTPYSVNIKQGIYPTIRMLKIIAETRILFDFGQSYTMRIDLATITNWSSKQAC